MAEETGVWLYAVTRGQITARLTELRGVGGEPVRSVKADDLLAVVSSVSLDEFGETALQRNLEDLDWLAATARAHDTVVNAVVRAAPTVPFRLATLYLGDERVRGLLVGYHDELGAALDRLAGRTEWGVKATADPDAFTLPVQQPAAAPAGGGAGTAYLLRRKAQLAAAQDGERRAAAIAEELHTALAQMSVAARRHPPQDPQLAGTHAWMVLNGTYLVDDPSGEDFAAAVRTLEANYPGVRLELTGPWPPYSFASIGQVRE